VQLKYEFVFSANNYLKKYFLNGFGFASRPRHTTVSVLSLDGFDLYQRLECGQWSVIIAGTDHDIGSHTTNIAADNQFALQADGSGML